MVKIALGSKKKSYKSIREASVALGIPYMTLYMRTRKLAKKPSASYKRPVRAYNKREVQVAA